jgi:hypothetical protein
MEPAADTCKVAVPHTSYLGFDREAGYDPARPAWKASTLLAYATPSCLRFGRTIRTCTSLAFDSC